MPRTSNNRGSTKEKKKSVTLIVGPFRAAFPSLFDPEEDDNGNEKFKVTMLFPPDSKSIKAIDDALYDCMEDAFGPESDWPSGKKDILPEDKFYDAGKKTYMGFKKGWMALTASSNDAPGIIDADKNEVLSKREVYGGRWMRAEITITSFDNKAKGVTAYLNHVQLLEHDEAFSGKGNAEDKFDKYELKDKRGRRRDEDDEEDTGRNRSSRRSRVEDEDDEDDRRGRSKGRGRSRDEDDEDDEKPRGRSRGRARDDDDEEDEKPRRSSRRDSRDDDDERPRRSRDREDEGRNSRPSRSSRSRDDDDEDEKPVRRSRSRARDDEDDWN